MIDINNLICTYIVREWLNPWLKSGKSQTTFANMHNIDESTIRKMKTQKSYRVPVETLYKICEARNIKLSDFFKKVGI
ncbi:helix-turn-helix transcriptional regulator [Flavobacterium sp. ST-75]|uniref:Helix-turn-helix transcriptional regulator n=1 Tax=Flavobacterium rhizophilum TaxID=3163296 RepID=A0ABW8YBX2_9FLAO